VIDLERNASVKAQTFESSSEVELSTATFGAALGQGMFQSHKRFLSATESATDGARTGAVAGYRAFSRRVGFWYSLQVIVNSLPLLLADIVGLTAPLVACYFAFGAAGISMGLDISSCLVPIAIGFVLLNFELQLYPGTRLSPVEELRRLTVSVTCIFIVWAIGRVMVAETISGQLWFLLLVYGACLIALPIGRSWVRYALGRLTNWWGIPVLVCGDDAAAVRVYHWLAENHHLGLRPVGVIGDADGLAAEPDDKWYSGPWSDASDVAEKRHVFWAVVVPPEGKASTVSSLITDYLFTIPQVHVLSELTGLPDHWNPQRLDGLTGIHLQQNLMLPLPRTTKRLMDIALTLAAGLVLSPFLFYIAVAVKLSSRGPVLYANERIGRGGRRFHMWKFRSMFTNGDAILEEFLEANPECREEIESTQKLRNDPRITRIGRFIRKTSLDELPQLWNVLRGDMSLVGPRPILLKEESKYGEFYPLYTMVKPGITGMWQVSGRSDTSYRERLQLVAYYVRNWSPWMDVYLLFKTVRIVLFTRGAV
jgi:Undecaprenyl-phosphate galactose phosphotransferase WbaP